MCFQQNANYMIIDWSKKDFELLKSLLVFCIWVSENYDNFKTFHILYVKKGPEIDQKKNV